VDDHAPVTVMRRWLIRQLTFSKSVTSTCRAFVRHLHRPIANWHIVRTVRHPRIVLLAAAARISCCCCWLVT